MLASLRNGLNTWPARLFFLFLVALFVAWGIGGDMLRLITGGMSSDAIATVGSRSIDAQELQEAYRRQFAQLMRAFGGRDVPPELRRGIAAQALEQLITQAALTEVADSLGLLAPEAALRQTILQIPAFRGANGQFDRTQYEQALRNNNLTEGRFLALLRLDLLQRQMMETIRAGAVSPDLLTREVYAYQQEKRIADVVELPFAAVAAPAQPTEAQLTRWYENHKDQYSTAEQRRIKAVILSPETVARDVAVTDEDLRGAYEQAAASYNQPEKRSAEVVLLADQAKAAALAAQWLAGADWAAIQAAGTAAGGTPVELTETTREQIPSPELAEAVFAATPGVAGAPVQTALGWYAVRVTKVTPAATKTMEEAREELRARVIADKAADLIYDHANKVEDLLAGGVPLDNLPGDLGLGAVTGTLDARGMTPAGTPAPIPGSDELRAALVQAAFQAKQGDPPRLSQVPAQGSPQAFFAVVVEEIVPPAPRPLAEVTAAVRADWEHDAVRHAQEEAAAKLLATVKGGQTLATAAAGQTVRRLPAVGRGSTPAAGVPAQLVAPLFGLKPGEPTMVETADGFVVGVLVEVQAPDPAADPIGFGQVRETMTRAIGTDMESAFATVARERARPRVNQQAFDRLIQQQSE